MSAHANPNIVDDGLVLCLDAGDSKSYPGSGTTWTDRSNTGNNGALINSPTFSSDNIGHLAFDGTDEYISIVESSTLDLQNYTYAFWIKRRQAQSSGWMQILQRSTSNRNPGIWFYINEVSRLHFSIRVSSGSAPSVNPGGFSLNEWHYFTATVEYDGTNTTMNGYTDGALNDGPVALGGVSPSLGTGPSYVGKKEFDLAALKVYNRALTDKEIAQNYNATKDRFIR
jgi:hypothetical protein